MSSQCIQKGEQMQRSAVRFVAGDYRRTSSVTAMYANLVWNSLCTRRCIRYATVVFRIHHLVFLLIICVYVYVLLAKLLCKCIITIIILQLLFKVALVIAAFKCLNGASSRIVYTKL